MASTYTPSDGTLHRFNQENLIEAQYALTMAKSKYGANRSSYSGSLVVDSNPRHNKTDETTISMSDFDQNNANAVVVLGTTGDDNFVNQGYASFIWGDSGTDTIRSHKDDVTISGGADNNSILVRLDNFALERNSLSGGSGDDTIDVLGSSTKNPNNISILGGKGNDRINLPTRSSSPYLNKGGTYHLQYKDGDGDDTIINTSDTATIKIASGTMDSVVNADGSHYFLTVGNNTVTIGGDSYNSLGKLNIVNSKGKAVKFTIKPTFKFTSGNDVLKKLLSDVTLDAGKGNDSIHSYGKNVSINGGAGNDTLYGGSGKDTFIYKPGEGKDVIYGFDSKDTLTLDGLDFSASYSKKYNQVTLTFDSGSIKLKDYTATTFHIDNDTYKISGSKFVKK